MIARTLIGILLVLTGGSRVSAQACDITLRGRILDRATREPLGFTTVGIPELATGTLADSTGQFSIPDLCPGSYHVEFHHLGCAPVNVFLAIRRDTFLTVWLDHHTEMLREIRVEGATAAHQAAQSQQTLGESILRQEAGRPLAEIIGRVTGVRSLRNGSGISKPVIHGLLGNRVAVINNGLVQAGQQWGADHAPEIDPNGAHLVRVVKGADAIAYGSRALGGAVVVEAGPIPDDPHLHGSAGAAFETNGRVMTLDSRVQQSVGPWAWRLNGTLKRGGDTRTPGYFLRNTGVREANAAFQLQYRPSDHVQHQAYYSLFSTRLGIFTGSHISNLTDLEAALSRDVPFGVGEAFAMDLTSPKQYVAHHLARYTGRKFVQHEAFWEWSYGMQFNHRKEFDIRRGDRSDIPALDLALWAHAVDLRYARQAGRFPFRVGWQATYTDNSNNYDTGILPLIPDYREVTGGVYGSADHQLGRFLLEGGVRYDWQYFKVWSISPEPPREVHIREHTFHDLAVSAGGAFVAGHATTRLHQSLVVRSPEVNELYSNGLHQGVAGIEEGDARLRPETGLKTTLSQSLDLMERLHIEIGLFSHLLYDFIYLQPEDELRLTIRGAFPVYRYRQQDAWLRGIDVVGVTDFSRHVEWTTKLSWMRGTSLADQRPMPLIPPLQWTNSLSWSAPDGRTRRGSKVLVEGEYTARQQHWDEAAELVAPPDAYFLMHVRVETGWRVGQARHLTVGIAADNLLNVQYRNYLNRLRYFADETGRSVRFRMRYDF